MTREPTAPHWVILAVTFAILFSTLLLVPAAPGGSLRIAGNPIPEVCLWKQASGLPCPGCGLSRSLVAAVHGDWATSLIYHRMGLVVLGYVFLQALARLAWLGLPSIRRRLTVTCRALDMSLVPLLILLVLNWIPTLLAAVGLATAS